MSDFIISFGIGLALGFGFWLIILPRPLPGRKLIRCNLCNGTGLASNSHDCSVCRGAGHLTVITEVTNNEDHPHR